MTNEQLAVLTAAASAKQDGDGWSVSEDGQTWTLYVASGGASLTVSRVSAVKLEGDLVLAKTLRDEQFVLHRDDVFAGATDGSTKSKRTAGFV